MSDARFKLLSTLASLVLMGTSIQLGYQLGKKAAGIIPLTQGRISEYYTPVVTWGVLGWVATGEGLATYGKYLASGGS